MSAPGLLLGFMMMLPFRMLHVLPASMLLLASGCFHWDWADLAPNDGDAQVPGDASSADGGSRDGGLRDGGLRDGGLRDGGSSDSGADDAGRADAGAGGGHDAGEGIPIVRAFDPELGRLVPADYTCRGWIDPVSQPAQQFELALVPFWRDLPPTARVDVRTRGVPTDRCEAPECVSLVFTGGMATAMLVPDATFSYRAPGTSSDEDLPSTAVITIGYPEAPLAAKRPIPIAVASTADHHQLLTLAGAHDGASGGVVVGVGTDCRGRPVWGASLRVVDADGVEVRADGRGMRPFYFDAAGVYPVAGRAMTSESGRFGAYAVPPDGEGRELCVELWGVLEAAGRSELLGAASAAIVEGGITLRDVPPLPLLSCSR